MSRRLQNLLQPRHLLARPCRAPKLLVVAILLRILLGSFWSQRLFWGCPAGVVGVVVRSFWEGSRLVLVSYGAVLGSFWACRPCSFPGPADFFRVCLGFFGGGVPNLDSFRVLMIIWSFKHLLRIHRRHERLPYSVFRSGARGNKPDPERTTNAARRLAG